MSDLNVSPSVASRLLFFVGDILKDQKVDPRTVMADLSSFQGATPPELISWADYIEVIERAATIAGGAEGVARAIRSVQATAAYSDLRALAGFFPSIMPFFTFLNHQLMAQLQPAARAQIEVTSDTHCTVRYRILPGYRQSMMYWHGTVALVEITPCHFDLPEAKVDVVSMTLDEVRMNVVMPRQPTQVKWGQYLGLPSTPATESKRLTPREQQVLELVSRGMTNAEIGAKLGTAPHTVKNQISAILAKMDAANRTELAAMAARSRDPR